MPGEIRTPWRVMGGDSSDETHDVRQNGWDYATRIARTRGCDCKSVIVTVVLHEFKEDNSIT